MNGMTGFNPQQVHADIQAFSDHFYNCYDCFDTAYVDLFLALSETWASPRAVEFSNTYAPKCYELLQKLGTEGEGNVKRVKQAFLAVASANGYPGDFKDDGLLADDLNYVADTYPLQEEKDGVVGMNIQAVVNEIIPEFERNIQAGIKEVESLPDSIAFYDADGSQQAAYSGTIKRVASELSTMAEEVKTAIINATNEEENQITLAKQQATETLSN